MEMAKVTPAAFTACRSIGASSQGRARSRASGGRVGEQRVEAADGLAVRGAQGGGGIGRFAQVAHGGEVAGDIEHRAVAHGHHRGASCIGAPDPAGERGPAGVLRQQRSGGIGE